jgi:hypothetical protein
MLHNSYAGPSKLFSSQPFASAQTKVYLLLRRLFKTDEEERHKPHSLGFQWDEAKVVPAVLVFLSTKFPLLEIAYKSNKDTHYRLRDPEGLAKGTGEAESEPQGGRCTKVWLSE